MLRSFFRALETLVAARRALKALIALIIRWESSKSSSSHSEWRGVAWSALSSSEWLGVARNSSEFLGAPHSDQLGVARSCLEARRLPNCKLF